MELDDSIAEVHLALGMHQMYYEWNFAAAENSLLRALELNPNQTWAVYQYAWLKELYQDSDASLPPGDLTVELEPLLADLYGWLAEQYRNAGQYERVMQLVDDSLELDPNNAITLMSLGLTYAEQGEYERAVQTTSKIANHAVWGYVHAVVLARAGRSEEAREILDSIEKIPRNVLALISINSALGEVDEAFHWMEVARDSKLPWYPWFITWFPFMDEVRADPRMKILAEDLGLEDVLAQILET